MNESDGGVIVAIISIIFLLIYLAIIIVLIAGVWKVFTKANQPGWAAIIPIYNIIVFLQVIGRPIWWIVLLIIPIVNIVVAIIVCIDLAKSFGKGVGYGIGIILLGIVFIPMLGFGSAQYQGPSAQS